MLLFFFNYKSKKYGTFSIKPPSFLHDTRLSLRDCETWLFDALHIFYGNVTSIHSLFFIIQASKCHCSGVSRYPYMTQRCSAQMYMIPRKATFCLCDTVRNFQMSIGMIQRIYLIPKKEEKENCDCEIQRLMQNNDTRARYSYNTAVR